MTRRPAMPCFSLTLMFALGMSAALTSPVRAQALLGASTSVLPDAPSALLEAEETPQAASAGARLPPCPRIPATPSPDAAAAAFTQSSKLPCTDRRWLRIVVNSDQQQPLTVSQKGLIAVHDVIDPFNLLVTVGEAAIAIGANSNTAFGPGLKGFGRLTGYQLLQGAQGEFFGTFLIPSLIHQDPRYRRMQNASVKRRILHAIVRTVVGQHDDGRSMPNYATLLTYPISAELSNLYVPGIHGNGPSTVRRIVIGYATDPASNLVAEFLPDLARRIHFRSIFVQQIVNSMARTEVGQ